MESENKPKGNGSRPLDATHAERRIATTFFVIILSLRVLYAFTLRVDSDESQHLHVVWGWANGLLPYRDLFDNHSPLFQMLCAPLFHLLGERADIVIPMRLAMIPIFAGTLWCVYKIGAATFSQRTGLWASILAGLFPTFFLTSIEFRTDDLWSFCWFFTLALLAGGPPTVKRIFFVGLVLGTAFCVSMKTSLLFAALLIATLLVFGMRWLFKEPTDGKQLTAAMASGLVGLFIVPVAFILFFAGQGALQSMYYCVIQHNMVPSLGKWQHFGLHTLRLPLALPLVAAIGYFLFRSCLNRNISSLRAMIFMTGAIYLLALQSYWPLITAQDYMPFWPLILVTASAAVLMIADQCRQKFRIDQYALPSLCACAEVVAIIMLQRPWVGNTSITTQYVAEMLRLTDPADYVMDGKGETIYRRRPFYYVLEGITIARIEAGLIKDNLPKRLIATRTCVVKASRLRKHDRRFVSENYVALPNKVWVAGKLLDQTSSFFRIKIPSRYAVIGQHGTASCIIDGQPYAGPLYLAPGKHQFQWTGGDSRVALVWAQAVERGFSPFDKRKTAFLQISKATKMNISSS